MSDDKKYSLNGVPADELEIFGEHKTREQVLAEEKERKKQEREAMRRVAKARREAAKDGPATKRKDVITISIVLVAILAICVAALALQFVQASKQEKFEQDETRTYFYNPDAKPEMTEDGLRGAITAAYYTKGGYLAVEMILGNGSADDLLLMDIDVTLFNEAGDQIASGFAEVADSEVVVEAGGTTDYTFYISPAHISIKDDPLSAISYTIDHTGGVLEK